MREKWFVGSIFPWTVSASCYEELGQICARGKGRNSFFPQLWANDPELKPVLDCLEKEGLKPDRSRDSGGFYPLRIERHYSKADLDAAQLWEFYPKPSLLEVTTRPYPGGPIQVPAGHVSSKLNIFDLWLGVFGVSRPVKEAMEADGLRGVAFEPIKVIGRGGGRWTDHIWQLASSVRMPKLSPNGELIYGLAEDNERPFDGDYNRMVILREGFYSIPGKRYRKSDLDGLGEFALAHTFERFGHVGEQTFIAGKPFYEFCVRHRFKIDWWPVRIDPD